MKTRIKELRQGLNLTQAEFGERIGYKPTAVGMWESGQRSVSDAVFLLICNEYNVNEEWLRTGQGEMFSETLDDVIDELVELYGLSDFARNFIETFVDMSPEQMEAMESFFHNVIKSDEPITDSSAAALGLTLHESETKNNVPIVGTTAAGVPIEIIDDLVIGHTTVSKELKVDYALIIQGDSMKPKINNGDIVLVKKQKHLENGQIGIFYVNGENTCKLYSVDELTGKISLESLNPDYPPIAFSQYDDARILGRVVFNNGHSK